MCGAVTIVVPDDIKVDTSCAACISGCVWCGGYMGPDDAHKTVDLCMLSWYVHTL